MTLHTQYASLIDFDLSILSICIVRPINQSIHEGIFVSRRQVLRELSELRRKLLFGVKNIMD